MRLLHILKEEREENEKLKLQSLNSYRFAIQSNLNPIK